MRNVTSPEFREAFERRQLAPIDAVPTHIPSLNQMCRDDGGGKGLARGWFVTVGANPGFGKSCLALNLTAQALKAGESVGYVSLEMTVGQIAARYYSIHSGVPIKNIERGSFSKAAWKEAQERVGPVPPLYVPENVSGSWEDVALFVRDCYELGCRWFVLDYLQLVQIGDEESINRGITNITTDLRAWAANNGAVAVVLSQFNRHTSANYQMQPRSQGLWGGMILEASSDLVLLLDHSRYKRRDSFARTWLVVDKNRHGPQGEIPILWDYTTLKTREGLQDEIHEWPE